MKKLTISLIILGLMTPTNANAASAGQYCKNAMEIQKSKTKMIQCVPTGANKKLRWMVVK